jgi:hypothetical protein
MYGRRTDGEAETGYRPGRSAWICCKVIRQEYKVVDAGQLLYQGVWAGRSSDFVVVCSRQPSVSNRLVNFRPLSGIKLNPNI